MKNEEELRQKTSEILIKWDMPTRQAVINEIVELANSLESSAYTRGREDAMFDISLSKGGMGNFGEKGEVTLTNTKHE